MSAAFLKKLNLFSHTQNYLHPAKGPTFHFYPFFFKCIRRHEICSCLYACLSLYFHIYSIIYLIIFLKCTKVNFRLITGKHFYIHSKTLQFLNHYLEGFWYAWFSRSEEHTS